jgi:hypothetical protein
MKAVELIDIVDLLVQVSECLDNYVDVVDGSNGEPAPNRAMWVRDAVDTMLLRLKREAPC